MGIEQVLSAAKSLAKYVRRKALAHCEVTVSKRHLPAMGAAEEGVWMFDRPHWRRRAKRARELEVGTPVKLNAEARAIGRATRSRLLWRSSV
jgi:hypothetical protein